MDKLEQYLDQVCRGVGGPRSLRQHLRQELREHLLDAVTEHRAAGLSEGEALERALADFGGPDQVRSELEATHGHRFMGVVIDKAMQWKERTMRAKWLWASWAYLALACVIALEVLLITFIVMFIIPKFHRLMRDGIIDLAEIEQQGAMWMINFLNYLSYVVDRYTTQLLLLAAALWGLFEWRVRSDNKPYMRLSALGTAAVGLMAVVVLMTGSLVITFCLGVPALGRMTRPWALEQVATIDRSISGLEQALAKNNWGAMQEQEGQAASAVNRLLAGPAVSSLTIRNEPPTTETLQSQLKSAMEALLEARKAIHGKDAEGLKRAMTRFHEMYGPIAKAAKQEK